MSRRRARVLVVALCLLAPALAAAEDVRLVTPTGALEGTLDVPNRRRPWPVALIVAGSGPTDRDGNQPALVGDSLKQLGRALAARGIAALRYDKRGVAPARRSSRRPIFASRPT